MISKRGDAGHAKYLVISRRRSVIWRCERALEQPVFLDRGDLDEAFSLARFCSDGGDLLRRDAGKPLFQSADDGYRGLD